ncbi:MAG TPA: class I SAM-dependent methyltransferase [Solirubrobacterales bacterium]|jgi:SAM-dependent methyltransferase
MSDEQFNFWNGAGGDAWVAMQPVLDRMFVGIEEMLADVAAERGAERVLDVGCGVGATTMAISRRLGAGATCTGVDISAPMVAAAKERAAYDDHPPRFLLADAAAHSFEPGEFDLLVSRFGVMFFADPVAAFARLRDAIAPGGGLRFVCWRAPEENPFLTTGAQAAARLLPEIPPREPGAPGPFAFAEQGRASEVLGGAGWQGVEVEPVDFPCAFPESDLLRYLARIGPIGSALREADDAMRAEVLRVARAAYEPFVDGDEVRFTARCWSVGAENR